MVWGLFYVGVSVISVIEIAALAGGNTPANAPATIPWFSVILLAVIYIITAATFVTTAVIGIQASSETDKLTRLDPEIIQKATIYWHINRAIFIYYGLSAAVGAILNTILFYQQLSSEEATVAAFLYWIVVLLFLGVGAYFLFVIWSYKTILHQARSGELEGPFVVRGVHFGKKPPTAPSAPGAPPSVAKV